MHAAQERGVRVTGEVREAHRRAGRERRALAAADGVDAGFVLEKQLRAVRRIEADRARDGVDLRVADAAEVERGPERGGVEQAPGGVDELAARRAESEKEEPGRRNGHRKKGEGRPDARPAVGTAGRALGKRKTATSRESRPSPSWRDGT